MMPNSDDPLLSSSPKDFASRKKFDFTALQSVKIVGNGLIDFGNPNLAGILVDNNGELKFIQTSGNPIHAKNIILTNATLATHNLVAKEIDVKPILQNHKLQKISKTTQCAITQNKINAASAMKPKLPIPVENIKQEENGDVFLSPSV